MGCLGYCFCACNFAPFGAMGQKLEPSLWFLFTANWTSGMPRVVWCQGCNLNGWDESLKTVLIIHLFVLMMVHFFSSHRRVYVIEYARCGCLVAFVWLWFYGQFLGDLYDPIILLHDYLIGIGVIIWMSQFQSSNPEDEITSCMLVHFWKFIIKW